MSAQRAPTFYFIGVTTSASSATRMFPQWVNVLGRPDVVMQGVDFVPHDEPARYRRIVEQIKSDPLSLGALVTTHKIDLLDATRHLFDDLDPYARICDEVSCIAKRNGQLLGYATDPVAGGLSLDAILGPGYFGRTGAEVLCFGAGGSAVALALHLINKPHPHDRPSRFVVVNRSQARLTKLEAMVGKLNSTIAFETICNQDPHRNDRIMADRPPGTLVVNATGMGKDRPGSPSPAPPSFPTKGLAWELNYRGELDFYHQALSQRADRRLTVEDGWVYFLHGWTGVLSKVLDVVIDDATFQELARYRRRRPHAELIDHLVDHLPYALYLIPYPFWSILNARLATPHHRHRQLPISLMA